MEYIPNFISEEDEKKLIYYINKEKWNNSLSRRTQHYGFEYDYTVKNVKLKKIGDLPEWSNELVFKLSSYFDKKPNQLIVNEYKTGQGIAAHIDSTIFGNTIASISLCSGIEMEFTKIITKEKKYKYLEQRSCIVLKDEYRYKWFHEIKKRKKDGETKRNKRISLTFRTYN
jgi:alkylated DNA repair dioxygenase AlkB